MSHFDKVLQDRIPVGEIPNDRLATNPLARASHTGTQTASTVSDFDSQVQTSRLDQMSAPTSDLPMGTNKITGLSDGTAATDAVTKQQMDAFDPELRNYAIKSANYTLGADDDMILVDTTATTQTLPATPTDKHRYEIKYRSATGSCTVATNTKNVDGSSSSITLNPDDALRVVYLSSLGAGEYVKV